MNKKYAKHFFPNMKAGDKYKVPPDEQEGQVLPNKLNITDLREIELAEAKGFIFFKI